MIWNAAPQHDGKPVHNVQKPDVVVKSHEEIDLRHCRRRAGCCVGCGRNVYVRLGQTVGTYGNRYEARKIRQRIVADATVKLSEAKLTKLFMKAPFSGTVGLRTASLGDYVKDGQDIVNLEKTDPIKVDFKIPEVFQSKVRVGQLLAVTLDALPGQPFNGNVYAVNPQLDTAGRAVVLRAQMTNKNGQLKPGMFARVLLTLSDTGAAVVVPEQALAMQGEEQIMYRVVDGRALRTKVEVGQRRDGKAEILDGVGANDTIVIAGWQRLRDGAPVRPAASGSAAPMGASPGAAPVKDKG